MNMQAASKLDLDRPPPFCIWIQLYGILMDSYRISKYGVHAIFQVVPKPVAIES